MNSALVRVLGTGCAILGLSGCESPVGGDDGTVTASIVGSDVRINNGTAHRIYYIAYLHNPGSTVDWFPCTNARACPSVAARSEVVIPLPADHWPGVPADQLVIGWWRLIPKVSPPGYHVSRIRYVTAPL